MALRHFFNLRENKALGIHAFPVCSAFLICLRRLFYSCYSVITPFLFSPRLLTDSEETQGNH